MKSLSPKLLFQHSNRELAQEHARNVLSSGTTTILTICIAELSLNPKLTTENLIGARQFIETFLNLSEIPEPPKPAAPDKSLGQPSKK